MITALFSQWVYVYELLICHMIHIFQTNLGEKQQLLKVLF